MAELVVGSYLFRYPLGGMASWVLQYLEGFARLGHGVTFVERADHHGACFDPVAGAMVDDPGSGIGLLAPHLDRIGLRHRWCFVDVHDRHHGMDERSVVDAFRRADAFLDMGTHGGFDDLAAACSTRVLLDGEPGFTQVRMERARRSGAAPAAAYDHYVTTGANIGTAGCPVPDAGVDWVHCWHPVVTVRHEVGPAPAGAPFTTVMNWRSHAEVSFDGRTYGQKDRSFEHFADLPGLVDVPVGAAVAGIEPDVAARLCRLGWQLTDGHVASATVDDFEAHVGASAGEIAICKHAFVEHGTGWFSDRSALFLAKGRPVVVQDTGLVGHLPLGEGLFAVDDAAGAADAIAAITTEPARHSAAARRIAEEHFDVGVVLPRLLRDIGIGW